MNRILLISIITFMCAAGFASAANNHAVAAKLLRDKQIEVSKTGFDSSFNALKSEFDAFLQAFLAMPELEGYKHAVQDQDFDYFQGLFGKLGLLSPGLKLNGKEGLIGIQFAGWIIDLYAVGFKTSDGKAHMISYWIDPETMSGAYVDETGNDTRPDHRQYTEIAWLIDSFENMEEHTSSDAAQEALERIRISYDLYIQENGNLRGYGIKQAVSDADLFESTLLKWSFSTIGEPPHIYVATSSVLAGCGAGKQVWYDVEERECHGFGIDDIQLPLK